MLTKVVIKNFLSIKDEETIKLNKDVTSIIGKNESGKSTILKAINKLNGSQITKQEKNVSIKEESSSIKGYFRVPVSEVKKINKKYLENCSYGFYSLPEEYENLYFSIEIRDISSSRFFNLYYMGDDNQLKIISSLIFTDRVRNTITELLNKYELTDEVKLFLKEIGKMDENIIKEKIKTLNVSEECKESLSQIENDINPKYWIELLPKFEFISFSSFSDVLDDNVLFSELENNQQAKNILRIADIDIEKLGQAFEENNEQELEDLQTQYIDIVSKKFKEIFQQTDEDFKLKIRFGTSRKEIIFLTQDKTSGTSSINLSQRSDGFRWYLSLYLTLYDYLNNTQEGVNYILLLDEPNLYLHPGAQNNLLLNVFYKEFSDVQIVYTTHSPYMIYSDNTYSIRIVEKDKQTKIYNSSREYAEKTRKVKDVDTISPLLTALELNISNSLIINDKDILIAVEGIQDVYILKAMIKKCKYSEKLKKIKFISGMSAEKLPFMFSYLYGMGYNVYCLVDNDKSGRKVSSTITNSDISDDLANRILKYSIILDNEDDFLLEDLFSTNDKDKYLPTKSTILYKRVFDEVDSMTFEKETEDNYKRLFDIILDYIK